MTKANCGSIELMSRVLAALASGLLLAGCVLPGTVQARAFTTGFKAGKSYHYTVHTVVAGTLSTGTTGSTLVPVNSDQRLTETLHVDSVDKTGVATVSITINTLTDSSGAALTNKPPPVTLKIGPDGRIVSGAGAPVGGRLPSLPGSDQLTPVLPDHKVAPGDTWQTRYSRSNPYGSGQFDFNSRNRYVKDDKVNGQDSSVLETMLIGHIDFSIDFSKLPSAQPGALAGPVHYVGEVNSTARYWLDQSDSQVLKSSTTGSYSISYAIVAPASQAGGPQQVTFTGHINNDLSRT